MKLLARSGVFRQSLVCVLVFAAAASARAEPRPYRGPHPLDHEGRWHLDGSVHVHEELAVGLEPFGEVDGVLIFLGDPIEYGFDGPVWTYRSMHPLPARVGGYCGVDGEHRHAFAPEGEYRREGEAYVYAGALRGGVSTARPGRLVPPEDAAREGPSREADYEADYVVPVLWWATPAPHPGGAHPHGPHVHPHSGRTTRPVSPRPPPARRCTSLTGRASITGDCPSVASPPPPGPPPRPRPAIRAAAPPWPAVPPARHPAPAPGEDPY